MTTQQRISLLEAEVLLLKEQIKQKDDRILQLERQVYGRRSEKQLPVYAEALPSLFNEQEGESELPEEKGLTSLVEEIQKNAAKRRTHRAEPQKRRTYRIPENIERREIIIMPDQMDLSTMIKIGEDVTERLHLEPAKFWVERIVRPVYKNKEEIDGFSTTIHQAPSPRNNPSRMYGRKLLDCSNRCRQIPTPPARTSSSSSL